MSRICRITPVINKQSRQIFALSHSELVESQLFKDLNNILKQEFDIKDDIDRRTALVDIWDNYRDVEYQIVTDNYIESTLEPNAYDVLNYLYNNDLLPSVLNIEPVEIEGKLREGRTLDVNSIYRKVISDKNIDTNIPAWKYRLRLNSDEARTFVKQMGALLITNLNNLQQQILEREQWYESQGQSKPVTMVEALWTLYSQAAKNQLDRTGQRSRYAENMFRKFRAEWFSPDLKLYKAFQRYMNKLYGISFIDLETNLRKNEIKVVEKQGVETVVKEDLDTEIEDSEDDLQESYWDGTQTLKVNRQDKIQRLVKFELAKIVIPEDVEAGGRKGIAYVPYYMDINEVWLSLINAHRYDLTTEDMLDTLERLSKVSPAFNTLYQRFNKVYKRLHQGNNQEDMAEIDSRDLNFDENFLHAYQYSVMGTMSEVISLDINPADKKISLVYPNRNSSPVYPVYDKAVNVFENVKNYYDELLKRKTSIMSDDDTGMYAFTEMLHYIETNYYNRANFADPAIYNKEVLLAKAFNLLGIPVTREGLHAYGEYYIKQVYAEDGIPSNFEDYYESLLEKGVFDAGNGVMIRNKNRNSDTENWAKSAYKKLTDPYLEKIYDKIYLLLRTVYRTMTERQYLNEEDTRQAKGILFKLATVATFEADTKIQAGYMDVNQSLNYTYQQDSYITKLFKPFSYRHAGVINQNKIIEVFRPFLDDKTLANSPFLYCDELIRVHRAENMIENSHFPAASYGLFRVKENTDGSKSITLNQAFASGIQLSLYNGFRNITTLTGIKYVDSLDAQWLFQHLVMAMNNRYIISSSDSAKMYTITIPPIAMSDMEIALKKILKNGLASFRRGQELCFNQTDSGFRAKSEKELNKLHQNLYAKNGKVLDDNGQFTGKAFQFLELQGNNGETFLEYLRRNLLNENEKDTKLFNYSDAQIETHFGAFVKDVVAAQRDKIDSMTKAIKPFLESYKFDGETVNTSNNRGGFIYTSDRNLLSDNAKLSKISKKTSEESDIEDLTEVVKKIESTQEQYRDEVLAAQLNAMINQIEFSYLMYGKMGEYKNSLDWNKRVGQIVKVGGNIYEDENNPTYDILIIDDIVVKSNLEKVLGLNEEVKRMHDVGITTTDGYSIILDDEYERLMRFQGKWNKVERYVNDMRDLTKIVNPADYHHVTEQMKTFIYDRLPVVLPNGETEMRSIQNKDSTGVFFERMAIGTQLEPLYKWLKAHPNIRKVAFASGVKVSGARPVTVFDANGNFVEPTMDDVQNAT
ncbi:MAG: hypothetical protein LBG80_15105, partial [Bacteroidales bacterium]|nr:hypothetical protein [Bacteroidales bacterium]